MDNRMKWTALALAAVLVITAVAPMAAQAGTLTIYNDNCTHRKGLGKKKNWITVKVKGDPGCTKKDVHVSKGETKVVNLIETTTTYSGLFGKKEKTDEYTCKYSHRAKGHPQGYKNVKGDEDSRVTCKKGGAFNACQCLKD